MHTERGAPPDPDDNEEGEVLEDRMLDQDRAIVDQRDTTASALRRGVSIDERLAEESDKGTDEEPHPVLAEDDRPDEEAALIGDDISERLGAIDTYDVGGPESPEESAVHTRTEAPGATEHPDDYVT